MSTAQIQLDGRELETAMSIVPPNYHAWILSNFEPYLKGTVAEIGAGSGNFSSQLINKISGKLIAVEPSMQMFPLLERRFSGNPRVVCEQHYFEDIAPIYKNSLDSIVYVNVLEHVENDQKELSLACSALKPGGHLCIFVPALQFLFSEYDASVGHHRRYYKNQLGSRLRGAGFEIVELKYFDIVGILPWLLLMKLFRLSLVPNSVLMYDKMVVPLMRRIESLVHAPVGKNLIVVGRRPLS
jgi:SAM-dependent methyltransferase